MMMTESLTRRLAPWFALKEFAARDWRRMIELSGFSDETIREAIARDEATATLRMVWGNDTESSALADLAIARAHAHAKELAETSAVSLSDARCSARGYLVAAALAGWRGYSYESALEFLRSRQCP